MNFTYVADILQGKMNFELVGSWHWQLQLKDESKWDKKMIKFDKNCKTNEPCKNLHLSRKKPECRIVSSNAFLYNFQNHMSQSSWMLWIKAFDSHNLKKVFLPQNKDSFQSLAKWKCNTCGIQICIKSIVRYSP